MQKLILSWKKKYKKRKISKKFIPRLFSSQKIQYKIFRIVFVSMFVGLFLFMIWLYVKEKIIFSYDKFFHIIKFSKKSINTYYDSYLYSKLNENLLWMHIWTYKLWWKYELLSKLQKKYIFLKDIKLLDFNWETAQFELEFKEPKMLIQSQDRKRAIYSNKNFYLIKSWNTLGSQSPILYLANYLSGTATLSGLFFKVWAKKIYYDFSLLKKNLSNLEKIVYLAWWERMVALTKENKKIIFNNKIKIEPQIKKYLYISQNNFKWLSGVSYNRIRQIDMGSLKYPIISLY